MGFYVVCALIFAFALVWLNAPWWVWCSIGAYLLWRYYKSIQLEVRPFTPPPPAPTPAQSRPSWDHLATPYVPPMPKPRPSTSVTGLPEIDQHIAIDDWNSARAALQRIAYTMVDADAGTKAAFTSVMTAFAAADPFFRATLDAALPTIAGQPGIKQADLYRGMSDEKKELIRYVFYFAAELGQIVRVKKGNSYALYLPGQQPDAPAAPTAKKVETKAAVVELRATAQLDRDEQIAALLRQSTAFKDAHNWDEAIASLYQAKTLMLQSGICYPAETWCKLPLYLQQAGRYSESMDEFQFLLSDLPARAKRDSRLNNPAVGPQSSKQAMHDNILRNHAEVIETKRALAQKREAKKAKGTAPR